MLNELAESGQDWGIGVGYPNSRPYGQGNVLGKWSHVLTCSMHFVFVCIVVVPIITATVRDNITDVAACLSMLHGPYPRPSIPYICCPVYVCKHDWKFDHSCTRRAHKSAPESSGLPAFEALSGIPKIHPRAWDIPSACLGQFACVWVCAGQPAPLSSCV